MKERFLRFTSLRSSDWKKAPFNSHWCFFPEIDILIFLMDCQYLFGMFLLIIIIILGCIKTVSLIFVVPISCLLAFNFHLTFSDNLLNSSFLDQSCILSWIVLIWSFSFPVCRLKGVVWCFQGILVHSLLIKRSVNQVCGSSLLHIKYIWMY